MNGQSASALFLAFFLILSTTVDGSILSKLSVPESQNGASIHQKNSSRTVEGLAFISSSTKNEEQSLNETSSNDGGTEQKGEESESAEQSSLHDGSAESVLGESVTDSTVAEQKDEDGAESQPGVPELRDAAQIENGQLGTASQENVDSPSIDSEMDLTSQIENIVNLRDRRNELHRMLSGHKVERSGAETSLQEALKRKSKLLAERKKISASKRRVQIFLNKIRKRLKEYEQSIDILRRRKEEDKTEIARLRNEQYWTLHEQHRIIEALRERGLEHWVKRSVKDSVSPFVSDALVQGTASVVQPVIAGLETLAAVNSDITNKVSVNLQHRLPKSERPFYAGFVTYIVLLFPLILVISVVSRIKRSIAKLSLSHGIILGNFYFLVLSGGCFVASLLGSVDVLLTFRHHNIQLFDFTMAMHGIMYGLHSFLHILLVSRIRTKVHMLHAMTTLLVGMHFFAHSYRHAMHHEDPHVDKRAYLVYTGVFTFILYELTVKRVRESSNKKLMTLNSPSITAPENEVAARGTFLSNAVRPRFPERRVLLFNRDAQDTGKGGSEPGRQNRGDCLRKGPVHGSSHPSVGENVISQTRNEHVALPLCTTSKDS